jgi:chromate transporter
VCPGRLFCLQEETPSPPVSPSSDVGRPGGRLAEVAVAFLRLGATSFGGPLSHLGLMREELVRRRAWVDEATFVDFLSVANVLPGPTSTEVAMQLGRARAGQRGLWVAGVCFILPAALLVAALAALYQRFGLRPDARLVLSSVQPVVVALLATAVLPLARATLQSRLGLVLFALALGLALFGANPLLVLLASGLGSLAFSFGNASRAAFLLPAGGLVASPMAVALAPLFLVFLKVGCVVLGSGYVLVAFLQADLVQRLHWLTEAQLLDAVAVGQLTPGPVFTTATFVGFLLRGPSGAVVATVAVFLPAFVGVWASGPLLGYVRRSPRARAFLDGVNAGSLALMVHVSLLLGRAALLDVPSVLLCAAALLLLVATRVNGSWVVLGAAMLGVLRTWLG